MRRLSISQRISELISSLLIFSGFGDFGVDDFVIFTLEEYLFRGGQ